MASENVIVWLLFRIISFIKIDCDMHSTQMEYLSAKFMANRTRFIMRFLSFAPF